MKKKPLQKKRKKVIFKELSNDYVVINGYFVVIDGAEDLKGATVIEVFSKDEKERDGQIDRSIRNLAAGGGGKFEAGKTQFCLTYISKSNPYNKGLAEHGQSRKMVIIKNKETKEIFLIAHETASLKEMQDFIEAVNEKRSRARSFQLPKAGSGFDETFTVVMHGDILAIKLEFD